MDDGSKAGSGFIFCTDSFTREEVLLLCHVLNDKFGLACAAVPLPLAATKGCGQGGTNVPRPKCSIHKSGMGVSYLRMDIRPYGSASYIRAGSMSDYRKLVEPYFHSSMLYQLR
jgi:hypothetical protein